MPSISMRKCCGPCQGGAQAEPQDNILDLTLLEAHERSVKFSLRAPQTGTRLPSSSSASLRIGKGPLDFVVSILGGPYSDIHGAREEKLLGIKCGTRATHDVLDLHPETEYTIQVRLVGSHDGPALIEEKFEARTANATTALLAEEDWGQGRSNGKNGFKNEDYMKDTGAKPSDEKEGAKDGRGSSSASSSWMPASNLTAAGPATSSEAGPQAAGRQDSQDDVSTNAPSEAGDARQEQTLDDNISVCSSEAMNPGNEASGRPQRENSSGAEAASSSFEPVLEPLVEEPMDDIPLVQEVIVIEAAAPRRTIECKFCSVLDCLKTSKKSKPVGFSDPDEVVIERVVAAAPVVDPVVAVPKAKRRFAPYRSPFPGTPVDPRTVGLNPGPGDLV